MDADASWVKCGRSRPSIQEGDPALLLPPQTLRSGELQDVSF